MPLKLGTGLPSALKVGSSAVSKAYLGSTQVYPASGPCTEAELLLHFDGNFTDSSINNLSVTPQGSATTSSAESKFGGSSFYSPGLNQYITFPSTVMDFGTGDFTVEWWLYITSTGATIGVWGSGRRAANGEGTYCIVENGNLRIDMSIDGTLNYYWLEIPAITNQWVHYALTRQGSLFTLWENGVTKDTNQSSGTFSHPNTAPASIFSAAGDAPEISNWNFDCYIDDFRVVKGTAIYTARFSPPTTALSSCASPPPPFAQPSVLLMHFDNNLDDSSASAHVATGYFTSGVNSGITMSDSKWGGYSVYLNGNSYIEIPYSADFDFGTNDFTIEAWIRSASGYNSDPSTARGFLAGGGFPNGWAMYQFGGGGAPGNHDFAANQGFWSGGPVVPASPADQWVHLAFVRSNGVITGYVDGRAMGTNSSFSGSLTANAENLIIGGDRASSPTTYPFHGYIDDLRIVKGFAVYTGTFNPPAGPLTASATAVPPIQQPSSLLLHFDSGVGDSSVNSHTATLQDNAYIDNMQSQFGGGALALDGTGDYVSVPHNAVFDFGSDDFTIEAWVRFAATPSNYSVTSKQVANVFPTTAYTQHEITFTNDSTIRVVLCGADDFAAGWFDHSYSLASAVITGVWYHVALTRQGNTIRLFLNGVLVGTDTFTYAVWPASSSDLLIGARYFNNTATVDQLFSGHIDEVRVVKGLAVYFADFTVPSSAPSATAIPYTKFLPYGTLIYSECVNGDLVGTYADGYGNRYTEMISAGSC